MGRPHPRYAVEAIRGPVAATLLGSVSRGVLQHAKRPVLVVKGAKAPVEATA